MLLFVFIVLASVLLGIWFTDKDDTGPR